MVQTLAAICQRDPNFFEHLVPQETQDEMRSTALSFWEREIKSKFADGRVTSCKSIMRGVYATTETFRLDVLDLLLTRDLSRAHVVDFNPYAPRTDPLLFEWSELAELHTRVRESNMNLGLQSLRLDDQPPAGESSSLGAVLPLLRIVTSPNQANRPMYSHNMIPADALSDSAIQFAAEMAVEMAQRAREAQEAERQAGER